MSATNRKKRTKENPDGERTPRAPLNHFPTPAWVTRVLVARIGISLTGRRVLECAAGTGEMVAVLSEEAGAIVDAIEIDSGRCETIRAAGNARAVVNGDFLQPLTRLPSGDDYDAVITNPPYSEKVPDGVKKNGEPKYRTRDLALEFVQKAITVAPVVAMLLRVNWAGSLGRQAFHAAHPADLVVLSRRPAYVGKGTDATEYAWWIWRRGNTIGTWSTDPCLEAPRRGRTKLIGPVKAAA